MKISRRTISRAVLILTLAVGLFLPSSALAVDVFVSAFTEAGEIFKIDSVTGAKTPIATLGYFTEDGVIDSNGISYWGGLTTGVKRVDTNNNAVLTDVGTNICGPEGGSLDASGNIYFNTRQSPCSASGVWKIANGTALTAVQVVPPFTNWGEGTFVLKTGPFAGHLLATDTLPGPFRIVRSSPADLAANNPPTTFITNEAQQPGDVKQDSAGNIYVTYYTLGEIWKYDDSGTFLSVFASELSFPIFMEFDSSDNLYVGENGAGQLTKIAPNGAKTFLAEVTGIAGVAIRPAAVDSDGDDIPDAADNCPADFNPSQADKDGDDIGDACDLCANEPGETCSYAETLSSPPATAQGAPLPVTACFTNDSGAAILTFPPDCFNTYFEVSGDGGESVLPPHYRHRPAYGIPDGLDTLEAGEQRCVTCDLSKMFDVSVLIPDTYEVEASFNQFIRDPDLDDDGNCASGPGTCFDIWIGSKTSAPQPLEIIPLPGLNRQAVNVDIKPGVFPNTFNCRRDSDNIPVGLLSSAMFDATAVNVTTVTFGKTGTSDTAQEIHTSKGQITRHAPADLNGDGTLDMIFHFSAKAAGFSCLDITSGNSVDVPAYLQGTANGQNFQGSDTLTVTR